jgi:hypothetical protein
MRPGLRAVLALVAPLLAAVVLAELGLAVFDSATSKLLAACCSAMLAGAIAEPTPSNRGSAAAAAATMALLLTRAPLPMLGLGAVDLGYGPVGEHGVITLPLAVAVAVVLFGLSPAAVSRPPAAPPAP